MPSFISVPFLLWVIAVGAAVSVCLLLLTLAMRAGRHLLGRSRSRLEEQVRPLLLRAVAGERIPEEAVTASGRRGRAVERVAFGYLARVRGEGHDLLAGLLQRRGVVSRVIHHSHLPSRTRRAVAASQLGLLATADAGRQLAFLATRDPSMRVRIVAARGLGKTGEPSAAHTLLSLLPQDIVPEGVVAAALLELGPDGAPVLREVLRAGPPAGLRPAVAADVLGFLDDMTACPELITATGSADPRVRRSAVTALGRLGMPQAAGAVTARLAAGEDPGVRVAAAWALGRIGDERAVPALAGCLPDRHARLARTAAEALTRTGAAGRRALAAAAASRGPMAAPAREALTWAAIRPPGREHLPAMPRP